MNFAWKSLGVAAAAAALACAAPIAAQATTVNIDGSFKGGGTVTGTISYGAGTMLNLTTTGGPFGSFNYTTANSGIETFNSSTFDITEGVHFPTSFSDLHLVFLGNFFSIPDGGTAQLQSSSFECWNSFVCPKSEPSFPGFALQTAVPEPASWALLMLGVGVIGAGLRFARKAQPAHSFS